MPVTAKLSRKFYEQLSDEVANELLDRRFAGVDARFAMVDARFAGVDVTIAELRAELIKWMFLFWIGTVVPLGGLMVALAQLR